MSVLEMARKYYPRLWDDARLRELLEAGRLTQADYAALTTPEDGGKRA